MKSIFMRAYILIFTCFLVMNIQAADVGSVFDEAVAMANPKGQELAKVIFKFIPQGDWDDARNTYEAEFDEADVKADLPDSPQSKDEVKTAFTKLMTEKDQPGRVLNDEFKLF